MCEAGRREFQIALTLLFFEPSEFTTPFWNRQGEARQNGADSKIGSWILRAHEAKKLERFEMFAGRPRIFDNLTGAYSFLRDHFLVLPSFKNERAYTLGQCK